MDAQIRNNEAEQRFEAEIDGQLAVANYQRRGAALVLTHTEVPPAFQGQGVGDDLARAALEHARAEGLKVVPECRFMSSWIRRHPEYEDLRAE